MNVQMQQFDVRLKILEDIAKNGWKNSDFEDSAKLDAFSNVIRFVNAKPLFESLSHEYAQLRRYFTKKYCKQENEMVTDVNFWVLKSKKYLHH